MKYIERDNIAIPISRIGLGTSRMGSLYEESFSFNVLDYFWRNGGNVLDTARNYYEWIEEGRGKSEQCIGKWMQLHNNRREICIITKGGTYGRGSKAINLSRNYLLNELDETLDALCTDYLDIYVLHKDEKDRPIEEIMETLQVLAEKGNVGQIGVDDWTFERIYQANQYAEVHGLRKLEVMETWWSVAEYTRAFWNNSDTGHMTNELFEYLKNENMLGIAVSPQCKGFFQKVIDHGLDGIDAFLRQRIWTERNYKKAEYIKKYCFENSISATAFVLGYITSQNMDSIAVVGISSEQQLEDILQNCDFSLAEEIIHEIDSI